MSTTLTASAVRRALKAQASPERAKISQSFFKTGQGEYGQGDVFLGVRVPHQRLVAKQFRDLSLPEILRLLHSSVHEQRLTALIILVIQFEHTRDQKVRQKIYTTYLANTRWINNWDLVDTTTPKIVGAFLGERPLPALRKLAGSHNLWEKRIAMISTQYQINQGDCTPAMAIAHLLWKDPHNLIQKAVGWMLREVGQKCSTSVLEDFLKQHAAHMPRTALRYAIEKFSKSKQQYYLHLKHQTT